jgi:16S rRNA (guanine527-N7)-methyltransferase
MSQWRISFWFPQLEAGVVEKLKAYNDDLRKWTKTVNLISPGTVEEADRIHFADAILGLEKFSKELDDGSSIYDFGSGNGIPGLVLAILRPNLQVSCVDSDERKIGFIKQLSLKLGLKNVSTICARVENMDARSISVATARGFAPLKKALSFVPTQAHVGTRIYHFKGQELQREMDEIPTELNRLWKTEVLGVYDLPLNGGARAVLKSTYL